MLESSIRGRLGATILALCGVFVAASVVPLPGLTEGAAVALPAGFWPWATGRAFSLGIAPFFAAATLGYVAICVVPSLRRLGNAIIARFQRTLVISALVWAALFAYHLVRSVNAITPLSTATKISWLIQLVGGVGVLGVVANWMKKRALGDGFALLLATGFAREVQELQDARSASGLSEPWLVWLATPLIVAALTAGIWLLRRDDQAYVRTPTAGIVPVVLAFGLPMVATALALFGIVDARYAVAMTPGSWTFSAVAALVVVALTLLLSRMWNRSVATNEDARMRKVFRYALGMSLVFGLVLVVRPVLPWRNAVDPLMVVVLVAVCFDVGAEVVFRRRHGDIAVLRSEWDVDAARRAGLSLQRSGIPVLLRGEFFLTVTRVFGLLTPIEVMVPANQADPARKICAELTS